MSSTSMDLENETSADGDSTSYVYDEAAEKALLRKQDIRILPLSAAICLLANLDRSNIGNAKILNSETHNDLLSETHMTASQYTIALMVFLIAPSRARLCVAAAGSFASGPPPLGWITSNVFTTSAVGLVIALNTSFGVPGQIVGVWIYKADEAARGYPTGQWTNCALLLFSAANCFGLIIYYRRLNAVLGKEGEVQRYKY
ncbi:putative transporter [Mycena sanguinolenta]|uniref:Putative transporter n=1 Tax=Mycena sanguinolenta TaxID=230812 RepID=A0A8H6X6F4_9AGAR|nr:putative transporter [Mycena sanguinolenta]